MRAGREHALHVRLFADEVVVVSVDARTGRLALHATGDMSAAGRASRFALISERLDAGIGTLLESLVRLRLNVRPQFRSKKLAS